jgi:HAD superfamily hydrolase (TIGR01509 family)
MCPASPHVTAVAGLLLDIDGTLIDSNDAHAAAFVTAMAERGFHVQQSTLRRLIGMGADKLLPAAIGVAADSARGKAIVARKKQVFATQFLPTLRRTPGARALLERAHTLGLRCAAASCAEPETVVALLRATGLIDLLPPDSGAADVATCKPAPDVVLAALKRVGAPAEAAILLGDTPYDVAAAQRAGMRCIALRCGGWRDAELAGAAAVYDHPADLLAHWDTSPLAGGP